MGFLQLETTKTHHFGEHGLSDKWTEPVSGRQVPHFSQSWFLDSVQPHEFTHVYASGIIPLGGGAERRTGGKECTQSIVYTSKKILKIRFKKKSRKVSILELGHSWNVERFCQIAAIAQ